ncbi:MAG: hypothetical protein JWN34_660 [Bryobacterales bacterium]|nr:hypothetical protein [Bryobacterales bacterium]
MLNTPGPALDLDRIRRSGQRTLVEFLRADLDLAFTFIETAAQSSDAGNAKALLRKAREALKAVRHFLPRVADPGGAAEVSVGADRLESALRLHET